MGRTVGKRGRKKRPPKLDDRAVERMGEGQEYLGGVTFDLEPDAEEIFLNAIEAFDPSVARKSDSDPNRGGRGSAASRAKPRRGEILELDLHSYHLDDAIKRVDEFVADVTAHLKGDVTVKIITGKGLHSGPGGSVLPAAIHRHVKRRYAAIIERIEESPAEVRVGGVAFRGHFHVRFRK